MKTTFFAAALLLNLLIGPVHASDEDAQKVAEIRKMIQVDGTVTSMSEFHRLFIANIQRRTDISNSLKKRIESEIDFNQLLDQMIPIYAKNFSLDDLKAINAFYASPSGRRLAEKKPEMMREGMAYGRLWGLRMGSRIGLEIAKARAQKYDAGN